jgi:hypothetical protein
MADLTTNSSSFCWGLVGYIAIPSFSIPRSSAIEGTEKGGFWSISGLDYPRQGRDELSCIPTRSTRGILVVCNREIVRNLLYNQVSDFDANANRCHIEVARNEYRDGCIGLVLCSPRRVLEEEKVANRDERAR